MAQHTPLKRLSVIAGKRGLTDLHIPTITEDAEDVIGMQGRIRLQKDGKYNNSQWMDKQRNNLLAYEYLCHIGEAKEWIEDCLQDEIEPIIKLEESLRNGIVLAKLANWFSPGIVRKIFQDTKLQFRHSDNINFFFDALKVVKLPQIFWFELTDLYEKKNIPKVIYCVHALSHLLSRRNMAPNIKNLLGQLQFTNEELSATQRHLDMSGISMPNFLNVGSSLRRELNEEPGADEELDEDYSPVGNFIRALHTPDLIIEEDSDGSDSEVTSGCHSFKHYDYTYWSSQETLKKLTLCQSHILTCIRQKEFESTKKLHRSDGFLSLLSKLQSKVKGKMARSEMGKIKNLLQAHNEFAIMLQASVRGFLVRKRRQEVLAHYTTNLDKLIKVQKFIKEKLVMNAYHKLTNDTNPPLKTVKSFMHLLDDSDLDFDQELELEDLRHRVIEQIQENNLLDSQINVLDIQIASFLKNAVSFEDVLKCTGAFKKKRERKKILSQMSLKSEHKNPYSLMDLDKDSRHRLELFQSLVYTLQTEPKYLSKLLSMSNNIDMGKESSLKSIESTILSLFGYATNSREEYLLINLCKYCIAEEIKEVENIQEFMCGNYTFLKLVVQTNRGAKEKEFFRSLLTPLVQEVVDNDVLDLDANPGDILKKCINEEESRTGVPSTRTHATLASDALSDKEVRDTFLINIRNLREITNKFFKAITNAVDEVPYGVRVIARELRLVLEDSFPDEPQEKIIRIIGNFIYYRYLNPAIVAPEQYDVIEAVISPIQRRNLAEISKMLQHIATGNKYNNKSEPYYLPVNNFIEETYEEFAQWFYQLTDVEDPECYFEMNDLTDQSNTHKPIIYIPTIDLYHLHYVLRNNIDIIEPEGHGIIHDICNEIGESPFSPDLELPETMVRLTLSNKRDDLPMGPNAQLQQLVFDTKRLSVYVIKIQDGDNLKAILESEVGPGEEKQWADFKKIEFDESKGKEFIATKRRQLNVGELDSPLDLDSISFLQLKTIAARLADHLELCKIISSGNNYQDIINMIAFDITGKNSRRTQRSKELFRMKITLEHLKEKKYYLLEQEQQYEGYLNGCMTAMVMKRGKKQKFAFPFTRQYFHIKTLQKSGGVPTFGSFKYTAKQLYERGVLLELSDTRKKHFDRVSIILSMKQAGVILIEGSYGGWLITNIQAEVKYEELLHIQFQGVQTMKMFDDAAKVNVNLILYLINRK
ncbi:hypothetical protein BDB01DRAFT_862678 [Pilobolus umbonatus]|nr:hypothetical protein BDB01DRAFT_862678 [Pilobolus umbonatus]